MSKKVVIETTGREHHILNISRKEVAKYRDLIKYCEICGNAEVASTSSTSNRINKLSVDHNHDTMEFRGLLCVKCNIQLGWYERHAESILKYLNKPPSKDR